ncbi:MAG TPA: thioredoxin family protein [Solirubrobacteraceae bacterium]|nr:thioredoxin family protein [Solirubrobacteraceae bacterium]
MTLAIGSKAPDFSLPDTAGDLHGPGGGAATVVVFTCNHCPYALAWHERIADVARDYAPRGVVVLAICSNDARRYPRDSYAAMQERVARDPGDWPMPYLHDATQEVARAYGAKTTPDVFVLDADGVLVYRGAPDADSDDPAQRADWLRAALEDLLADRPVARATTDPVGCSIKWAA